MQCLFYSCITYALLMFYVCFTYVLLMLMLYSCLTNALHQDKRCPRRVRHLPNSAHRLRAKISGTKVLQIISY